MAGGRWQILDENSTRMNADERGFLIRVFVMREKFFSHGRARMSIDVDGNGYWRLGSEGKKEHGFARITQIFIGGWGMWRDGVICFVTKRIKHGRGTDCINDTDFLLEVGG